MDDLIPGVLIGVGLGFCIGGAVFMNSKGTNDIQTIHKRTINERLVILETKMAILIDERDQKEKK